MRMDIKSLRRVNLLLAMEEFMAERQTGSGRPREKDFAEYCEINPEHLSQMKHGHRQIGDSIARRLEKKLGKPYAWMDLRHTELSPQGARLGERFDKLPDAKQRFVLTLFGSLEAEIEETDKNPPAVSRDSNTPGHNPCAPDSCKNC